jgi:hypothetical protein
VPDSAYQKEVDACSNMGIAFDLIDYEALVEDRNAAAATRKVKPIESPELAIFRGWMMKPDYYNQMRAALAARNLFLINSPDQYRHCHYLPESYSIIEAHTPRTVFLPYEDFSIDRVMELLIPFGTAPVILKDYVKSQKHKWAEACFITSSSDRSSVERVVKRFLELQGDDLNEGLVFREYEEFQPLANHSKSGMPLTREFRVFYLEGKPLCLLRYWDEGDYSGVLPPVNLFDEIAQRINSRFFTMDIAQRKNGEWRIVELGDGQVAGLPDNVDVEQFYSALNQKGVLCRISQ